MTPVAGGPDSPRGAGPRRSADAGSGTVWVLLLVSVVWAVGTFTLALGQALSARHRAGGAADLAALAAAERVVDGRSQACGAAERVVRANDAHLVACAIQGDVADVLVEVPFPALLEVLPPSRARARAGPSWAGTVRPGPGEVPRPKG
ncbi:MAG: Rv3654c family TadE-like protein [Carbonactinosporaceae bacterium]